MQHHAIHNQRNGNQINEQITFSPQKIVRRDETRRDTTQDKTTQHDTTRHDTRQDKGSQVKRRQDKNKKDNKRRDQTRPDQNRPDQTRQGKIRKAFKKIVKGKRDITNSLPTERMWSVSRVIRYIGFLLHTFLI